MQKATFIRNRRSSRRLCHSDWFWSRSDAKKAKAANIVENGGKYLHLTKFFLLFLDGRLFLKINFYDKIKETARSKKSIFW